MHIDRSKAFIGQICCLIAALFLAALYKSSESEFLLFLAFVPMIGFAVFAGFNRCPHCRKWLGRHSMWIDYCPYCGEHL